MEDKFEKLKAEGFSDDIIEQLRHQGEYAIICSNQKKNFLIEKARRARAKVKYLKELNKPN
jgi:hypothetical protein